MRAGLHGVLLGGQPERVVAHGVQHVVAGHPQVAAQHVGADVAQRVPDVQAGAGRVGEHVQQVDLVGPARAHPASAQRSARVGRVEGALGLPAVLPGQLDPVGQLGAVPERRHCGISLWGVGALGGGRGVRAHVPTPGIRRAGPKTRRPLSAIGSMRGRPRPTLVSRSRPGREVAGPRVQGNAAGRGAAIGFRAGGGSAWAASHGHGLGWPGARLVATDRRCAAGAGRRHAADRRRAGRPVPAAAQPLGRHPDPGHAALGARVHAGAPGGRGAGRGRGRGRAGRRRRCCSSGRTRPRWTGCCSPSRCSARWGWPAFAGRVGDRAAATLRPGPRPPSRCRPAPDPARAATWWRAAATSGRPRRTPPTSHTPGPRVTNPSCPGRP